MNSPRAIFHYLLLGSCFSLTMSFDAVVLAQGGGLGPDPYRPYNSQYDAFVYPVAPGNGDVVPSEAALSRAGLSRGNQFQDYLRRNGSGYANSTARNRRQMDPKTLRDSQYQPNRNVDEESGFYEKQDFVSQAYFSYLREKDPKKRAELLREYQQARRKPAREFAASKTRRQRQAGEGGGEDNDAAPARRSEASRARSSRSNVPPSPRLKPSEGSGRSRSSAVPPPPPRGGAASDSKPSSSATPSDVLEESLKRDREMKRNPSTAPRSSDRIPPPPSLRGSD